MVNIAKILDEIEDLEELEEIKHILKEVFRVLGDSMLDLMEPILSERAAKMYAKYYKTLYDELIKQGFSKEEAISILLKPTEKTGILELLSSLRAED